MSKDWAIFHRGVLHKGWFATEAEAYEYALQHGLADRCHHLFAGYTIQEVLPIDVDAIYKTQRQSK